MRISCKDLTIVGDFCLCLSLSVFILPLILRKKRSPWNVMRSPPLNTQPFLLSIKPKPYKKIDDKCQRGICDNGRDIF